MDYLWVKIAWIIQEQMMMLSFLFSISLLQHSCPHPSELLGSFKHISWEPIKVHDIRWNFEKFLVGPDGVPVMRWLHWAPVSTIKSDILVYLKQFETK